MIWRGFAIVAIAAVSVLFTEWMSDHLNCNGEPAATWRSLVCVLVHLGPALVVMLAFVTLLSPVFNAADEESAPPDERQALIAQSLHAGPRWRIYADALGLLTLFVLVVLGWYLSVPMHSAALKSAFACCVVLFIGAYLARRRVARNDRRSASRAVRAFWLAVVVGLGLALGLALLGPPFESGIPSVAEALPVAVGTITITSLLYDWLDPLGRGSVYLIAVAKRQSRS